ncbi:hypothetical protein COW36_01940 [bacterium (Candidatus Blackallbacteria) CG17_big_fil_post_rev_8_21_14_2_50_48_46]|uniref:Smr domain-containing protein n=1 Tax=bacterium (Candidatus Blackallbacteria) CG17_big_fil_post_rev_8_21_14_2_50_48_46 TaxID=2014261 RepID=A0A2M7GAM4_9BACT|nr:MAG: hypothetical protein COW64_26330 [bacterium (Candidatus Blackallbacteria) CG18_big_fil_WC_8_21_14_2_50_49_26]PIW19197.1 MAG: hypothetical protein COW36_01940 [bacterium (Candidatus Blackallbacteria) CG17_big_fil_post_rev_8_21_14_2_50_48_46]PIW45453.1 MAG: hypothetical protein COW20_20200 [bacterium (Candidatus Blackallbacteria) CG13_big_fil_rev_8_21_14_2_50_49_14]
MKPASPTNLPSWDKLTEKLAELAITPGAKRLAYLLKPVFSKRELESLQRQFHEFQNFLAVFPAPFKGFEEKSVQTLLSQLERNYSNLLPSQEKAFEFLVERAKALRGALEPHQKKWPALWQNFQTLKIAEDLLKRLEKIHSRDQKNQLFSQRWRQFQEISKLLSGLDFLNAKFLLAQSYQGNLVAFSKHQEIHLSDFRFPQDLLQDEPCFSGELHWSNHENIWLLTGAHESGKTRLLENIGLAVLMHQAGLPIPAASESHLPVFSDLQFLPEDTPLRQSLNEIQSLLRRSSLPQLLLWDNPLTGSNPGESHALLRALLQELAGKPVKLLLVTHNHLLTKLADENPAMMQVALERKGQNLKILPQQRASSELFLLARKAGWPAALVNQAEQAYAKLKPPKTKVQAAQPAKAPRFKLPQAPPQNDARPRLTPGVEIGVWIFVESLRSYGELLSLPDSKGEVSVLLDGKKWKVQAQDVLLSSHRKEKKGDTTGIRIITYSIATEACDLHNLRVHEAEWTLEKFLDTATHGGLHQVSIIHGKGEGALRRAVHAALATSPYVKSFRLAEYGKGDSGVTVVELN